MRYRVNAFEFNSHSLVLTLNGETVAIRHNEAKVLAMLLKQPDKVFSKEDILSVVWHDKVVSEQAVFQNISHLRNVFGRNAIKTFPKRGYQWQLEIELIDESSPTEIIQISTQSNLISAPKKRSSKLVTLFFSLTFIIVGTFIGFTTFQNEPTQENSDSVINLAYIPFTITLAKSNLSLEDSLAIENNLLLESSNHFAFTELSHLETAFFINSSELEYPVLSKNHPFVLTGEVRSYQQVIYLDFWLKGPMADWQGQLSGASIKDVTLQLQQHLKQPFIYQFLSEKGCLNAETARRFA